MAVRAKMRVTGVHDMTSVTGDGQVQTKQITMQPVYGGDDDKENQQWSRWTPSGELRLAITNPEAFKQFELGKAYYVDFNPVT